MRYVERPGRTIADTLIEKDPWYRLGGGCSRRSCPICYWSKGKGIRCSKESVCYKIECTKCEEENEEEEENGDKKKKEKKKALYIGETSRSGRERI